MAHIILQDKQHELLQQERQLASDLKACLQAFEETNTYAAALQQATIALDELFLLVVVGEFNSGKSACINALLHNEVLEEGVIPTTHQVTILRYGPQKAQLMCEQGLLELVYPADFLRDISIVDTPGVNAVLLEHQRLTEEFVPRSDLILFITSVDRPFTQSERVFLEHIRAWGKKIVILLNKIDLLHRPGLRREPPRAQAHPQSHQAGDLPRMRRQVPLHLCRSHRPVVSQGAGRVQFWQHPPPSHPVFS